MYAPDISPIQYAMLKVVPVFNKNALYVIHEVLLEYSEMYRKFMFLAQYSIIGDFGKMIKNGKLAYFRQLILEALTFAMRLNT